MTKQRKHILIVCVLVTCVFAVAAILGARLWQDYRYLSSAHESLLRGAASKGALPPVPDGVWFGAWLNYQAFAWNLQTWESFLAENQQASARAMRKVQRIRDLTAEVADMMQQYVEVPESSLTDADKERVWDRFIELTDELNGLLNSLPRARTEEN